MWKIELKSYDLVAVAPLRFYCAAHCVAEADRLVAATARHCPAVMPSPELQEQRGCVDGEAGAEHGRDPRRRRAVRFGRRTARGLELPATSSLALILSLPGALALGRLHLPCALALGRLHLPRYLGQRGNPPGGVHEHTRERTHVDKPGGNPEAAGTRARAMRAPEHAPSCLRALTRTDGGEPR